MINGTSLIEDAAESLGSLYYSRHTGTFGRFAAISFNGNKIITTGGGGVLLCKNEEDAKKAKHLSTTKIPHTYEYYHDNIGYNYRMPNLNAALGCAQIQKVEASVRSKRELSKRYKFFFQTQGKKVFERA